MELNYKSGQSTDPNKHTQVSEFTKLSCVDPVTIDIWKLTVVSHINDMSLAEVWVDFMELCNP